MTKEEKQRLKQFKQQLVHNMTEDCQMFIKTVLLDVLEHEFELLFEAYFPEFKGENGNE